MNKLYILFFCISFSVVFGQKKYPQNDFRNPMDFPIILAGTFGELRGNHFHAGIDIKTKGISGKKVHTAKEGYVSRIKISLWGYGKAIYITHPNGYTTVYGHLSKFSDRIEKYINKKQYAKESFNIQVFPRKDELIIKKDEIIAYSGNSGGSAGPHLHFEIRDTKTEKIINPLLFGLKVPDNIPPKYNGLRITPFGKGSAVNGIPAAQKIYSKKVNSNLYISNQVEAIGKVGLQINTYDLLNNASNKNGVYSIDMTVNDSLIYHHDLETFSFDESKYINLLIDYEHNYLYHKKYQKTYIEPENKLSIYETDSSKGYVRIEDKKNYKVEIIVKDIIGNKIILRVPIKGKNTINPIIKENKATPYFINKNKYNVFKQGKSELRFPKNTFYKNFFLDYKINKNSIHVHKPNLPLDKSYTLTYFIDSLTKTEKKYVYFAYKKGKNYNYINTNKKGNKIYTNTKYLGDFYLKYDSISPIIYKPSFYNKQNISKHKTLSIYTKDKQTAIKNYYATIDGKWVLMEYQPKRNRLFFNLSDLKATQKQHKFKLKVQDMLNNTKTYEASFYK